MNAAQKQLRKKLENRKAVKTPITDVVYICQVPVNDTGYVHGRMGVCVNANTAMCVETGETFKVERFIKK